MQTNGQFNNEYTDKAGVPGQVACKKHSKDGNMQKPLEHITNANTYMQTYMEHTYKTYKTYRTYKTYKKYLVLALCAVRLRHIIQVSLVTLERLRVVV